MNASGTSPVQRRSLRATVAGVAAIAVVLLGGSSATAASVPNSMASVGDSITRAYNTGSAFADNPAGSWSTGTSSTVVSHYTRLLALNPAISGHAFNDAKSGALMVDLAGQLATAASQHVDYVTILMGGNDVCQPSEAAMTPVATFEGQFSSALASFTAASPATSVYVVSLPNVRNLWSALKGNALARFVWALGSVCPSMLARPLSTTQSDEDRRARVLQREIDYNAALARICAQYVQCRFDGNAVFGITFTASDVSTRDYFHPSLAGQKKLAAVSWTAGSWGP
ncbi:MAG TPA: SGNH/GDSL hydrolase family protein [Candidatus Limnocylindrales bacterium]|nr:SGNH/GDSL hydrolase family protein [Candidatus Limnocylindrales bacterium]